MQKGRDEIRVSAKTLDKALKEAATQLNIDESKVGYRIISQTKGGILSFIGRKVEIAAFVEGRSAASQPVTTSHQSRDSVQEQPKELSHQDVEKLVQDLKEFCEGICARMFGETVGVSAELDNERLVIDIQSESLAAQYMKNSKIPEALEHLIRKKPRHLKRELPFRIFIDINGNRQARELELVELAKDLSEKVHENRRPIVLNYKSSYDRKIIHMALDKDERVYTKSIGAGSNRKLMILPNKKKSDAESAAT